MKVYDYVDRNSVPNDANIVNVKWVHVNKGTMDKQVVRCRLVAQEFNDGSNKDELFAVTPPLYIVRAILSLFATGDNYKVNGLMVLDVKGAFLYGSARRDIYIELPREDSMSITGKWLGKLNKAMYGTRDAPQIWQDEVESKMKSIGFVVSGLYASV